MAQLPSGNVTLLFTDIEGSTKLLQRVGNRYWLRTYSPGGTGLPALLSTTRGVLQAACCRAARGTRVAGFVAAAEPERLRTGENEACVEVRPAGR